MLSGKGEGSPSSPSFEGNWECKSLEYIQPQDRTLVGDKVFYLSQLLQKGYPVISGFVVPAQVRREFLETINWSDPLLADLPNSSLYLDVDNPRQLQLVAQRLRQEITAATLPPKWVSTLLEKAEEIAWETTALILRPSLGQIGASKPAFTTPSPNISGLLETYVCAKHPEAIALGLKRAWAEVFRARSLLYWQRAGIELQQINLAVLVQPLTNAIASGSLKCHPDGLEIQASWGLGLAIVRGEVLPDSYLVQPETGAVRKHQLGNKTIAYGLVDSPVETGLTQNSTPLIAQPPGSCLQTYLLSEAQQQEYALDEKYLQQLIQLAQQLRTELGSVFTLEWNLSTFSHSVAPELYLTQVSNQIRQAEELDLRRETLLGQQEKLLDVHYLIRGLAAAAGTVRGTAHVIANANQKPDLLPPGVIIVASAIAPDWLPLLQQAAGVVTERGGLTSHAAILARELGIPAVVSVREATQLMQTGELVLLDGNRGEIHRLSEATVEKDVAYIPEGAGERTKDETDSSLHRSAFVSDSTSNLYTWEPFMLPALPIATKLLVNLSQPASIERVSGLPVDGVGLLRSELMAISLLEGQHPNLWLQQGRQGELVERWQEHISQFARAFAPRPVFYRSLDWRSHEFSSLFSDSDEENEPLPMLGQRGTFSYQLNPTLFDLELAALAAVQQSGYTNIHLLLPFVRTVEEFSFCRRRVERTGLTKLAQFQLWIMAEVPSVLFLLPQYVKAGVQGVSIGTNDLTQLLLGVDREQGQLQAAFDERHPAVMQAVAQIIQMARQEGIPCSICGQAPALYPEIIDSLVGWGITSISVESEAVERTYIAIARAEKRLILEAARRQLG